MIRADPKTIARVRRLYGVRVPVSAIMERTGLTRRQVDYHTRDMPHPGQGWAKKWDRAEVAALVDRLTRKLKRPPSLEELGAAMGVSKSRAHAVLHKCEISKPAAPGSTLSVAERAKRQAIAARRSKRQRAMAERKIKRDMRIIAMAAAKKTRAEIADRLGVHVNVVYRVLRSAGKS